MVGDIRIGPWGVGLDDEQKVAVAELLSRVRAVDGRSPDEVPGPDVPTLLAFDGGSDTSADGRTDASADGRTDASADGRTGPGTDPVTDPARIAGLAWREGTDPAELYVHPDHRGRGIGRRLAAATLASGPVWAHGTFAPARHLADSLGATATRELLQLRRECPDGSGERSDVVGEQPNAADLPNAAGELDVMLPDGVHLRTFHPGVDDDAFLAVNGRAFAWHPEQGRLDRAGLRAEMTQSWFDAGGFFLAVDDDDRLLGFHWTKVHQHEIGPDGTAQAMGEVYVIGVDPDSPIRHLGTPLLAAGLNYLARQGLRTTMLYVESDNERAVGLYERYGFRRHAVDTVFTSA